MDNENKEDSITSQEQEYVCDLCGRYDKEYGVPRRLQDSHKDSYIGWLCFACDDRINEYILEAANDYAEEVDL